MNARTQSGNRFHTFISRVLSLQLILRAGLFSLLLVPSGCANLRDLGRSDSLSASSPIDAKSIARSQASLALSRAETAEREGNKDEAIRYYEQARTLNSDFAHLSRRLAVLYDQRGDDARARAAYEQALQLQPQDPDLLNDFGVFYLHREDWSVAETWFRRSLDIDATHQRATNNLAMSLAMQNRLSESYEAFTRVVEPAAAYSNLGVLLTRQGRIDEAREHFQRSLALDQSIHRAHEFLSQLDSASGEMISAASTPSVEPVSYRSNLQP